MTSIKNNKKPIIRHIKEVEHDIKKEIAIRNIIRIIPIKHKSTTAIFKEGLSYFIEFEAQTEDFFFHWFPKKIKKYLKLIIPFALMLFFLFYPFNLSPEIKKALALFICISLLWALESINIVVTALLIPVLAVSFGLMKNSNPFSSFSNPIIYLLLSGLILAQAFRKHHLDRVIAVKVLALSKGNIKKLLFYTMLITAVLGMWMSNTATIALLIPVILSISNEINHKTKKNYTAMLLLSAGFASSIGGLATILGGSPNAITAAFLRNILDFGFFDWVIVGLPISIILFIVSYFIFLNVYSVGNEKIEIFSFLKEAESIRLTYSQKKTLAIFFPTLFLWFFGGKISFFFRLPIEVYTTEIIGLTSAILIFIFHVLEWEDVRKIPWEIFLIVGGGLTLGQILINTGAATLLAGKLFSLLSFMPTILIILSIIVLAMILANFVNNSSATIILVPVLLNLSSLLNINTILLAMTVAMATTISSLTPIAMPSFSMIYGTGKVSRKEMIKIGVFIALICGPVLAGMIYLMNNFIF